MGEYIQNLRFLAGEPTIEYNDQSFTKRALCMIHTLILLKTKDVYPSSVIGPTGACANIARDLAAINLAKIITPIGAVPTRHEKTNQPPIGCS